MSVNPGGSNSGSAVAVAANLAVAALRTETFDSIISPAHHASLVGLKPTVGLVSTDGVIPLAFSQDCVGPMARSVRDTAIILNILGHEKIQLPRPGSHLKKTLRVGVFRDPFWKVATDQLPQLENLLSALKNTRLVTIVDPVRVHGSPAKPLDLDLALTVVKHEFKFGVNKYLNHSVKSNDQISSLAAIIKFNNKQPKRYRQRWLIASEATDGLRNETNILAKILNLKAARRLLSAVLKKYNLDAIVTPTEHRNGTQMPNDPYTFLHKQVPAGFTKDNLPFGFLFQGAPNSEHQLLKLAAIVEEKIQARRPPRFLP